MKAAAVQCVAQIRQPDGIRYCPKCGSDQTRAIPNRKPMPYRCAGCQGYFSTRTSTAMQNSRLPVQTWLVAVYLITRGLARMLGITQKSAWYMPPDSGRGSGITPDEKLTGPVEADETYIGDKAKNKPLKKKRRFGRGQSSAGARAIERADSWWTTWRPVRLSAPTKTAATAASAYNIGRHGGSQHAPVRGPEVSGGSTPKA